MASLSPGNRLNELWLPVVDRFLKDGFEGLPEMEGRFFAVFNLLGEVASGGFAQYFSSSTGHLGKPTVDALEAIGCPVAAGVLIRAIAVFPDGQPQEDWELRQAAMQQNHEHIQAEWRKLEVEFAPLQTSILEKLETYVSGWAASAGS